MTREYAGLALLDAAFLCAGLGVLAGLGFVRSARDAVRLSGVAFTVGWAAAGVTFVLALVVGAALTGAQILVLCAVVALAGLLSATRTPAFRPGVRRVLRGAQWPAVAAVAVLVLYAEALGRRAFGAGASYHGDAWGFWLPKAKSIVLFDGLYTGLGGLTSFYHADYPPLVPALNAAAFRFMDEIAVSMLPVQEWLFAVAFVAAVAGLLAPRVPAIVLWPGLAVVGLMPAFARNIGLSLADQPLAFAFALAGLAGALWVVEQRGAYAGLAAVLLAAAALTKKEGLLLALLLVGMLALVSAGRLRRQWPALAIMGAAPVLAVLPWRLWLRANDVSAPSDYRLSDLLDTGLLADKAGQLESALVDLPPYLVDPDRWLLAVPLALCAAALAARRAPRLAVLVVGTAVALVAGLVAVYWVSPLPPAHYIDTSAERALSSLVLFVGATFPLLLSLSLEPDP